MLAVVAMTDLVTVKTATDLAKTFYTQSWSTASRTWRWSKQRPDSPSATTSWCRSSSAGSTAIPCSTLPPCRSGSCPARRLATGWTGLRRELRAARRCSSPDWRRQAHPPANPGGCRGVPRPGRPQDAIRRPRCRQRALSGGHWRSRSRRWPWARTRRTTMRRPPFRGREPFRPEDRDFFFGRDADRRNARRRLEANRFWRSSGLRAAARHRWCWPG